MKHTGVRSTLAFLMLFLVFPLAASAQLMIIGNDEKVTWDDAGKQSLMAPARTRSPSWTSPSGNRRGSSSTFR